MKPKNSSQNEDTLVHPENQGRACKHCMLENLWLRFFGIGILLVDFLELGSTINSEKYCEILLKFCVCIQTNAEERLARKFCFFKTTPACTRQIPPRSSYGNSMGDFQPSSSVQCQWTLQQAIIHTKVLFFWTKVYINKFVSGPLLFL